MNTLVTELKNDRVANNGSSSTRRKSFELTNVISGLNLLPQKSFEFNGQEGYGIKPLPKALTRKIKKKTHPGQTDIFDVDNNLIDRTLTYRTHREIREVAVRKLGRLLLNTPKSDTLEKMGIGIEDIIRQTPILDTYRAFKQYGHEQELGIIRNKRLRPSTDRRNNLAFSIIDHDLATQSQSLISWIRGIEFYGKAAAQKLDHDSFMRNYNATREGLSIIAFLSTKDHAYLSEISTSHVPAMIGVLNNNPEITYDINVKTIRTDQFWVVDQLIKNALDNLQKAREKGITVGDRLEVKIYQDSNGLKASVLDEGTGITYQEIPAIFKKSLSGGSGTGMKVVKKIADLYTGENNGRASIEVISTVEGGKTYMYEVSGHLSTLTKEISPRERGTLVSVYFNK